MDRRTAAAAFANHLSGNPFFRECVASLGRNMDFVGMERNCRGEDHRSTAVEVTHPPAITPTENKALIPVSPSDIRNVEEMGVGVYGKTFKGVLQDNVHRKSIKVAVKVFIVPLFPKRGNNELVKLLEMEHRNVVSMIGVVLDNNFLAGAEGPRLLMDYYPEGNLLKFLAKKDNPQDYAMLGKLAIDIISGCKYLHEQDVVHGNLAARNILIQRSMSRHGTHFNAKVSDFGIVQFALGTSAYQFEPQKKKNPSLKKVDPVRWMPKELVELVSGPARLNFTKQSDIWSFGVVLWEMWTKGATPWGSLSREEFNKFLIEDGKSPLSFHRPRGCPEHITGVMEMIFKTNPKDRPSFDVLSERFTEFRTYHIENKAQGHTPGHRCEDRTPTPMPSSSSIQFHAPIPTLENEIQRQERQLQLLKTQQLQMEFMRKQAEMDDIVRKMAQTSLAEAGGGMDLPPGGFPVMDPPPPYNEHDGHEEGGREREHGGRSRGGGQMYRGRGGGGGGRGKPRSGRGGKKSGNNQTGGSGK